MVNKLPPITGKYGDNFITVLNSISEDKIYTMLMEMEPHKVTGLDGLQAKFLIDSAQSILKTLTHIIIMSIIYGVFPKKLRKKLKLFQFVRKIIT